MVDLLDIHFVYLSTFKTRSVVQLIQCISIMYQIQYPTTWVSSTYDLPKRFTSNFPTREHSPLGEVSLFHFIAYKYRNFLLGRIQTSKTIDQPYSDILPMVSALFSNVWNLHHVFRDCPCKKVSIVQGGDQMKGSWLNNDGGKKKDHVAVIRIWQILRNWNFVKDWSHCSLPTL